MSKKAKVGVVALCASALYLLIRADNNLKERS